MERSGHIGLFFSSPHLLARSAVVPPQDYGMEFGGEILEIVVHLMNLSENRVTVGIIHILRYGISTSDPRPWRRIG